MSTRTSSGGYSVPTVRLARVILIFSTVLWALCFPLPKGAQMLQAQMAPTISDQELVCAANSMRFGMAFLILLLWQARDLMRITRLELSQGIGLGLFSTMVLLFQMLALRWTDSSIVAFLSQLYSLFVPLLVAIGVGKLPSTRVMISCALVLVGAALLSPELIAHLKLGPGEIVTIISALFIAGQILWVNRPIYKGNRTVIVTLLMFGLMTLNYWIMAMYFGGGTVPWGDLYSGWPIKELVATMVVFCTVAPYYIMNAWQPKVSAVEASMIYCSEPVIAAILATFIPGWLSLWTGVHYANEQLSGMIWLGGGLIVLATVLVTTDDAK